MLPNRYNVGHVAIGIGDLGLAYQVTRTATTLRSYYIPVSSTTFF